MNLVQLLVVHFKAISYEHIIKTIGNGQLLHNHSVAFYTDLQPKVIEVISIFLISLGILCYAIQFDMNLLLLNPCSTRFEMMDCTLNPSYTFPILATIHHDSSRCDLYCKIGMHRDG